MLSVEDWAGIRRMHRAEGLSIKTIAKSLGISPNAVRAAIAGDAPPRYQRRPGGSAVIPERVGWTRGIRVFKERLAEPRPAYLPPDPASRTTQVAQEVAQRDVWFPPTWVPVGFGHTRGLKQLPLLTMVTGYARWLSAILEPAVCRGPDCRVVAVAVDTRGSRTVWRGSR